MKDTHDALEQPAQEPFRVETELVAPTPTFAEIPDPKRLRRIAEIETEELKKSLDDTFAFYCEYPFALMRYTGRVQALVALARQDLQLILDLRRDDQQATESLLRSVVETAALALTYCRAEGPPNMGDSW